MGWILRIACGGLLVICSWAAPAPASGHPGSAPSPAYPGGVGIVVSAPSRDDVLVDVWKRAADEQGLPSIVVDEMAVVGQLAHSPMAYAALILPDGLIRSASGALVEALSHYVDSGGRLLVVFDAATLNPAGFYVVPDSRLSSLVGIEYAMYDRLRETTTRRTAVYASAASSEKLGLPPGKTVEDVSASPTPGFTLRLSTYGYPHLVYASFSTRGNFDGEVLLRAEDGGLVAGVRKRGRGRVIFANLPLGGMKLATDGWLLHRFLRLLAEEAFLPTLAMTPGAVGGMVMNLHCDSNAALGPLKDMDSQGFFDGGPYSIHVTAGPGLNSASDGLGINVPQNPDFQYFLRSLVRRGHEIGSHGGWIHNDWAAHVTPQSEAQHGLLLELNGPALEAAANVPVQVYSSPSGNHPPWVSHWLRRHGYLAFYTTANDGSAPTRLFRDGVLEDDALWSFPIMSLGTAASFEDAASAGLSEAGVITPWLQGLVHYTADEGEVRLVYFHPTGVHLYGHALAAWTAEADSLARAGRFRWYRMADLVHFLDRREQVRWRVDRNPDGIRIVASADGMLDDMAWRIPAERYLTPKVISGTATVTRAGHDWRIIATGGTHLVIAASLARTTQLAKGPAH